ncbi:MULTISPECIES: TrmB family transcriptional regulator [Pseudonocardia]|uniref:Sugar-specific transcriptional regulator TrmB n=2 Tax=Pseudonocardia TaxID=1847 RepID=A0A1Y2N509_PSEAH|nr:MULTISPECIES: helix-turn-helix domain-containing protein [Pseudonocardia]OSY42563.1 Sugar-specific transcriptional regulator TrmB [Pseudonocardia autotrophica]TDN76082.1 transcriptional regulator [Pseudonocardia autotrophica]GEC29747.1 transcriptional regulator [Pseudonocardia saturnea]
MAVHNVTGELQRLGMSGYEAKAYVALVLAAEPVNGYEVAKRSGVPRSTVYETLGKLVGRGAAYEVRTDDDAIGYVPLPPRSLLERMRREFDRTIGVLEDELPRLASPPPARLVHSLGERSTLLERAEDIVTVAEGELYMSGWPEDLDVLTPGARRAEERGVAVRRVVFGHDGDRVGWTTEHRYSSPETVEANLGQRLLVVVADRSQAVIGGLTTDRTWGLYTDDPAAVLLALDYVRHDIAMHVVADRYAEHGFDEFWSDDHALRLLRGTADPSRERTG